MTDPQLHVAVAAAALTDVARAATGDGFITDLAIILDQTRRAASVGHVADSPLRRKPDRRRRGWAAPRFPNRAVRKARGSPVTHTLTELARERYLADSGERPFPFAEDLAGILAAVNTRVGGTDALFEGQEGNTRTSLVTSLIADGSEQRPAPEDGRCRMVWDWNVASRQAWRSSGSEKRAGSIPSLPTATAC